MSSASSPGPVGLPSEPSASMSAKALLAHRGRVGVRLRSGFAWGPEAALVPLCAVSIGLSAWQALGELTIGSISILPLDIALAVALLAFLVTYARDGLADVTPTTWLATSAFLCLLLFPVFIGLAVEHEWQSVVRQIRVAACWSLLAIAPQIVRERRAAERLLLAIVALVLLAALYALICMALGWRWGAELVTFSTVYTSKGLVSRGYGLASAIPWYCVGAVISLSYARFRDTGRRVKTAFAIIGIALGGMTLATLMRTTYVGLFVGIACLAVIVAVRPRSRQRTDGRARPWRLAIIVAGLIMVAVAVIALAAPASMSIVGERLLSIVRSGTSEGADATKGFRVVALETGVQTAVAAPMGSGYGKIAGSPSLYRQAVVSYAHHSGIAWPAIYLGIAGGLVLLLAWIPVVTRLLRGINPRGETWWGGAAAVTALATMVGQSLGGAVFYSNLDTIGMVPLLTAIALLPTRLAPGDGVECNGAGFSIGESGIGIVRPSLVRVRRALSLIFVRRARLIARLAAGAAAVLLVASAGILALSKAGVELKLGETVYAKTPALTIAATDLDYPRDQAARRLPPAWVGMPPGWRVVQLPYETSASARINLEAAARCEVDLEAFSYMPGGEGLTVALTVDGRSVGVRRVPLTPSSTVWHVKLPRGTSRVAIAVRRTSTLAAALCVSSLTVRTPGDAAAPTLLPLRPPDGESS